MGFVARSNFVLFLKYSPRATPGARTFAYQSKRGEIEIIAGELPYIATTSREDGQRPLLLIALYDRYMTNSNRRCMAQGMCLDGEGFVKQ